MAIQERVIPCGTVPATKNAVTNSGWKFLDSAPEPGMDGFCRLRYDDLAKSGVDASMPHSSKLSEHFSLSEMIESQEGARRGLDNTPSAAVIDNLLRVCGVLESIRAATDRPVRVSSGYRSPAINAAVGGAAKSMHVEGLAADINVPGMTPKELATLIAGLKLPLDQIILEYDSWVHIGLTKRTDAPRHELLTIRKGTGYLQGIV
jgi:zinc D-Ala-D-Ala carboxypeptidase